MVEVRTAKEVVRIILFILQVTTTQSENSTRSLVKTFTPSMLWIPYIGLPDGRIYKIKLLLNWSKVGNDLTSSLSFSHSEIQYG